MSLLEKVQKIKPLSETVTIDGESYVVTGCGTTRYNELDAECRNQKTRKLNATKFEKRLICECVTGSDGTKFGSDDWKDMELPRHVTGKFWNAIVRVNGLDSDDVPNANGSTED